MEQNSPLTGLIDSLPSGIVRQVQVGLIWTLVGVEVDGRLQAGVAASLQNPDYERLRKPAVRSAGELDALTARQLAGLVHAESFTEAAIGLATVNALLPRQAEDWLELSAEEYILQHGAGKNVALIGHFAFTSRLRGQVGTLYVLELNPGEGDLPASTAPEIVPQADLLVITATTLINGTLEGLLALRHPAARTLLVGPSTPLSPQLFDWGFDALFGTVVTDPLLAVRLVAQGASMRQMKHCTRQVCLLRG